MLQDLSTLSSFTSASPVSDRDDADDFQLMSQAYKIYGGVNRRSRGNSDSHQRRRLHTWDHNLPAPEFLTDEAIDRLIRVGGICPEHKNFY